MERRSFLLLLASAPIAALGPWEKLMQQPLCFVPEFISKAEFRARYIQPWAQGVAQRAELQAQARWDFFTMITTYDARTATIAD